VGDIEINPETPFESENKLVHVLDLETKSNLDKNEVFNTLEDNTIEKLIGQRDSMVKSVDTVQHEIIQSQ
jgi:hypothetical protein